MYSRPSKEASSKKQVMGKARTVADSHFSYLRAVPGTGQWAAALRLDPAVTWYHYGSLCSRGMFVFGKRILSMLFKTCFAFI